MAMSYLLFLLLFMLLRANMSDWMSLACVCCMFALSQLAIHIPYSIYIWNFEEILCDGWMYRRSEQRMSSSPLIGCCVPLFFVKNPSFCCPHDNELQVHVVRLTTAHPKMWTTILPTSFDSLLAAARIYGCMYFESVRLLLFDAIIIIFVRGKLNECGKSNYPRRLSNRWECLLNDLFVRERACVCVCIASIPCAQTLDVCTIYMFTRCSFMSQASMGMFATYRYAFTVCCT